MLYNEHLELLLSFVQAESSYDNAIRFYFDLSDEDDTDDLTIRFLSMTPEEKKEWIIERTKYAIRDYRRTKFLGKEIDYSLLKNYKELNEEKDILTQEKKRWVKEIDSYIEGLRKIIDDDKERAKLAYEDFQKKQKQIHESYPDLIAANELFKNHIFEIEKKLKETEEGKFLLDTSYRFQLQYDINKSLESGEQDDRKIRKIP